MAKEQENKNAVKETKADRAQSKRPILPAMQKKSKRKNDARKKSAEAYETDTGAAVQTENGLKNTSKERRDSQKNAQKNAQKSRQTNRGERPDGVAANDTPRTENVKKGAPSRQKKQAERTDSAPEKKNAPEKKSAPEKKNAPAKNQRGRRAQKPAHDPSEPFPRAETGSGNVRIAHDPNASVRIIPLGGLHEIGKNMTAIECGDDIVVIDCGLAFPDDETPGVDLVIPDVTYLEANASRVRGIVLTHGHEDHIGAIPYVLRNIDLPIYGTKLTLGIVRNKLKEFTLATQPRLICVSAGDTVRLGGMSVEFIHVNHSIADACALAIRTPLGTLVHSGDFKLDLTPIDGEIMDLTRFGELGREGVLLLMCESTNAERPGHTPSERKVGASLEYIFNTHEQKRIVIATFSSNVHRVQQIIDTAARHNRKVAITGRSMLNIVGAAVELGYMNVPKGVLIDISEINKYSPHEITLVTTGSQGEPMSALYRMAFGEHREVTLCANDVVVISSTPIPGNEKLVGRIVNELCRRSVEVIHDAAVEVHVSGHACQEEIKLLMALTKPRYLMPVHGEYKHLAANRELAMSMGIRSEDIFISEIGNVLEIDKKGAKINGTVTSGRVLVDGYGVGDVGNIVLRDRLLLSQDGLIVVAATVSADGGYVVSGPDIVSRGFVYVRESEDLMEEMRKIAEASIEACIGSRSRADWYQIKGRVRDDLAKYIYSKTKRKPMILPMIMNA